MSDRAGMLRSEARAMVVGARAVPNQLPGVLEAARVIEGLLGEVETHELALKQIAEFCEAHAPFASVKSEVVARRCGDRARAALSGRGGSGGPAGG